MVGGARAAVAPTSAWSSSATAYSACDVTLAIGAGEGFGYTTIESQLCGTPVYGCKYAATEELVPVTNLTPQFGTPLNYWLEGPTNVMRPICNPEDIAYNIENYRDVRNWSELYWDNLWPEWERWFKEGLE